MGYGDRFSARAGDTPELKISIEDGRPSFRIELVRLTCGDDGPNGPGLKAESITSEVNGVRSEAAKTFQPVPMSAYRI